MKSRWRDVSFYMFTDEQLIDFICYCQKSWYRYRFEAFLWEGISPARENNARLFMKSKKGFWYRAVRELAWRQAWDWLNERRKSA